MVSERRDGPYRLRRLRQRLSELEERRGSPSVDAEGSAPVGARPASVREPRVTRVDAPPPPSGPPPGWSHRGDRFVFDEAISPRAAAPDHFGELDWDRYPTELVRSDALFFDLETTGLAGGDMIFMAGFLFWEGGDLRLVQEIACDRAEEGALVEAARERLSRHSLLVTFNGKSFDVPALERRLFYHRAPVLDRRRFRIVDLLHLARRRHRREFVDCRLGTLERELLRKPRRAEDLPSAEVPLRFEDYRGTRDWSHLAPILYHNRIDLATLVALWPLLDVSEPELDLGWDLDGDASDGPADSGSRRSDSAPETFDGSTNPDRVTPWSRNDAPDDGSRDPTLRSLFSEGAREVCRRFRRRSDRS